LRIGFNKVPDRSYRMVFLKPFLSGSFSRAIYSSSTRLQPFNKILYKVVSLKGKITSTTLETNLEQEKSSGAPSITTSCPPVTSRKLQWDWTQVGELSIQPCPIGATGLAKWNCIDASSVSQLETTSEINQNVQPQWFGTQPDMSDCKSVAMSNLEAQVRKEDPENVLISSLSYVTRTKALYGGDLVNPKFYLNYYRERLIFENS